MCLKVLIYLCMSRVGHTVMVIVTTAGMNIHCIFTFIYPGNSPKRWQEGHGLTVFICTCRIMELCG